MITKFNATIKKGSKVATARCKAKKFLWLRKVTYDDGSTETVQLDPAVQAQVAVGRQLVRAHLRID